MRKVLSIAALLVSLNSSALTMVSHTSSSRSHNYSHGYIQSINDTTFMYHFQLDDDIDNDTIIYARTSEECLAIAKDYSDRHDNSLISIIGVVLIIPVGWYLMYRFLKF